MLCFWTTNKVDHNFPSLAKFLSQGSLRKLQLRSTDTSLQQLRYPFTPLLSLKVTFCEGHKQGIPFLIARLSWAVYMMCNGTYGGTSPSSASTPWGRKLEKITAVAKSCAADNISSDLGHHVWTGCYLDTPKHSSIWESRGRITSQWFCNQNHPPPPHACMNMCVTFQGHKRF